MSIDDFKIFRSVLPKKVAKNEILQQCVAGVLFFAVVGLLMLLIGLD